eukprot:scaffold3877_cov106-Alexandrium_tamarense.AAC.1
MKDIARIRGEFATLIDRLSPKYLAIKDVEEKAAKRAKKKAVAGETTVEKAMTVAASSTSTQRKEGATKRNAQYTETKRSKAKRKKLEPQKKMGEVGYTFRKQFDDGWFEGKGAALTAASLFYSYNTHSLIMFAVCHLSSWTVIQIRKGADNDIPSGGEQYTFFLERFPATNDIAKEEHGYHNLMSIDDLWSQICQSRGQPVSKFVSPLSKVNTLPALPVDVCGINIERSGDSISTVSILPLRGLGWRYNSMLSLLVST